MRFRSKRNACSKEWSNVEKKDKLKDSSRNTDCIAKARKRVAKLGLFYH